MPRIVSQASNAVAAIKESARLQMQNEGTGALSLRGIARELNITAPALYRYFPTRDDLITALIVDAFNALADAIEAAQTQTADRSIAEQLMAASLAYRAWAVEHPTDFQLIYGNPIVGYEAPREITVPAVVRGFRVFIGLLEAGIQNGDFSVTPAYQSLPGELAEFFQHLVDEGGYPVSLPAFYMGIAAWTQMHGIIMLELYGHLLPTVGNGELFYRLRLETLYQEMGLRLNFSS